MSKLFLCVACLLLPFFSVAQHAGYVALGEDYIVETSKVSSEGFSLNVSFDTLALNDEGEFLSVYLKGSSRFGAVGSPSFPVLRRPFAIPANGEVKLSVKSYSVTDIDLSQYGGKKLMPQQPPQRKDVPAGHLEYDKEVYETDEFLGKSLAWFSRVGTMRGVEMGELNVVPMKYNPVTNVVRFYNNIVVEVSFVLAGSFFDTNACSPFFAQMYSNMLNRDVLDSYSDLYHVPVRMLVVAAEEYAETLQPWIEWKTQKGFYIDIDYVSSGATSEDVARYVHSRYSEGLSAGNAPVFLVLVGDVDKVPSSAVGSESSEQTDLYYASVDGDYLPEMYCSRLSVESASELASVIEKTLMYEKYTMPDPSYLDNVLLIAGEDGTWNPAIAQPTINYATQNYFNADHGFANVHAYLDSYSGCYSNLNTGVGYAHYTAHGGETEWCGPNFTCDSVLDLQNDGMYFLGIGNCCLSGKFGYTQPCYGEVLIRASKRGAFAYIGSSPVTYWYEDYYWALGATNVFDVTPQPNETQTGAFDLMFDDDIFNTVSSIMHAGNLSVTNSYNEGYTDMSPRYYWEAYNVIGDGSIMPYLSVPSANAVSHGEELLNGSGFFQVEANPGSYVAITDGMNILGTGLADDMGIANVRLDAVASADSVLLVVTRQQRIPHIEWLRVVSPEGAYLSLDGYSPSVVRYDVANSGVFALNIKNIGLTATEAYLPVRLRCADANVEILDSMASCPAVLPSESVELDSVFSFRISGDVSDCYTLQFSLVVDDTVSDVAYVSNFGVRVVKPEIVLSNMLVVGNVIPGSTFDIGIEASNRGSSACGNVRVALQSLSANLDVIDSLADYGELDVDQSAEGWFGLSVSDDASFGTSLPLKVTFITETLEFEDTIYLSVDLCNVPITELPFTEAFDGPELPDCWSQQKQGASTLDWHIVETDDQQQYANEAGNTYAYIIGYSYDPMYTMLVSPKFEFRNPQRTAYLSFRHIQKAWYSDQDKLSVYYKQSDTSEWVLMRIFGSSINAWRNEQLTLPNLSECYYIGFSACLDYGFGIALDDVKVEYEECEVPVVSASENEQGQVTITWTGNADKYILYKNGVMLLETTSNTYDADSNDDCYVVEAHCGDDVVSSSEYCVGVDDFESDSYGLYPNPAAGEVAVMCPADCEVKVCNTLGNIVLSKILPVGNTLVSLSGLASGVYLVQFETFDGKVIRKKLVIE